MRLSRLKIQAKLLLIFCLFAALPMLGTGFLFYRKSVESVESMLATQTSNMVIDTAAEINANIEPRIGNLELLANNAETQNYYSANQIKDQETISNRSNQLKGYLDYFFETYKGIYANVSFLDIEGKTLTSYQAKFAGLTDMVNIGQVDGNKLVQEDSGLLRKIAETPTFLVSLSLDDGSKVIRVGCPVNDFYQADAQLGFVIADIHHESIIPERLVKQRFGRKGGIWVLDVEAEKPVIRSAIEDENGTNLATKKDVEMALLALAQTSSDLERPFQKVRLVEEVWGTAHAGLVSIPWVVMLISNMDEFTVETRKTSVRMLILMLAVLLIGFGLIVLATGRITGAIRLVTQGAEEMAKGNLDQEIAVKSHDEVRVLADQFNQMGRSLKTLIDEKDKAAENLRQLTVELEDRVKSRTSEIESANVKLQGSIQAQEKAYNELQNTQSQLIQSEKMAGLGTMVAGICHEINNPINFVYANMPILEGYLADLKELIQAYEEDLSMEEISDLKEEIDLEFLLEDLGAMIGSCREGAERVRQIVLDLRNFSRLDEAEQKEADIHQGIDSTLTIVHNRFKDKITVHKKYGEIPSILCYPGQLNQVVMNLLANAADAIDEKGEVWIKTWQDESAIYISIRDSGKGIPEEKLSDIFVPFFTTKPVGEGTGLGLAVSHQIIERHGGEIKVESEVDVGTAFIISIPLLTSSI